MIADKIKCLIQQEIPLEKKMELRFGRITRDPYQTKTR
jgi:hypothetical protein